MRNNKLRTFLLFLLISASLWMAFQLTKTYQYQLKVPVTYTDLPADYHQSFFLKDTLKIQVSATGFQLLKYKFSQPELQLAVKKLGLLKQQAWSPEKYKQEISAQIGQNMMIENILPAQISLKGKEVFKKKVAVLPNVVIRFKQGFRNKVKAKLEPDSLWVFGPEKEIDTITDIKTDFYEFSKVSQDVQKDLALKLPQHIKVSQKKVSYYLPVGELVEDTLLMPVEVLHKPKQTNLVLMPEKVLVKYKTFKDDYAGVDKKDFLIVADFNKRNMLKNGAYLFPVIKQAPLKSFEVQVYPEKISYLRQQ